MDRAPHHLPPPRRHVPVEPDLNHNSAVSPGQATIQHLQRTIGNQRVQRLLLQRANSADPRLPANQAEALSRAKEAKRAIDAAIAAMRTSAAAEQRNAVQFMTQRKWVPAALTPRHDSPVGAPAIHFFPGQNNYTGSQTLDAQTTHKVSPKRTWVYVRARDHANVDNPLAQADIQSRITAAVSEVAHTKATHPGQPVSVDLYRARFNGLFDVPPFNALSNAVDLTLDSRGPRTRRARAIFDRILTEEPTIRAAYDANTGGLRGVIDTYAEPDGMNRVNSPRLQRLREAFFAFKAPVADFSRFRNAIRTAAAGLDATDRKAFDDSNDWQQLVNAHVTDEAQRIEIRAIISQRTQAQLDKATFATLWTMRARVDAGAGLKDVTNGSVVRYLDGTLQLGVNTELQGGRANTGLALFVRSSALRGSTVVGAPDTKPFPPRDDGTFSRLSILQPTPAPAADTLTISTELLDTDRTTVLATRRLTVTASPGTPFTKAQALASAREDQAFFRGAFLTLLRNRGGHAARVATAIAQGTIKLEPQTPRHDSRAYVANKAAGDPSQTGFFHGVTYGDLNDTVNSFVSGASTRGATPSELHGVMWVERTFDVAANAKIADDDVIKFAVHEAVHALDATVHRADSTNLDHYKSEFRAYWMEGIFGPPDQATCQNASGNCLSTEVDPNMSAPGPKSPRARAIFEKLYATYPYVKPDYDNNVNGFREAVDRYVWPDGINLILSKNLDDLQKVVAEWDGGSFPALRTNVLRLAAGLTAEERQEINRNREWRELVEKKVTDPADRVRLESDLGIPR